MNNHIMDGNKEKTEDKSPDKLDTFPQGQYDKTNVTEIVIQHGDEYVPKQLFSPEKAKAIMCSVLKDKLSGLVYDGEAASGWARDISDTIKARIKGMELERYKIVVQVAIGEKRGQSLQMACRCFWEPSTDSYAQETYLSDDIFAVAATFAMYHK